jgi:hypothetical protein
MTGQKDGSWLMDQADHLTGATLTRRIWEAADLKDDHDHCAICWAKFSKLGLPDGLRIGWCTADGREWVCQQCVDDFKSRFQWTLNEDSNFRLG